MARYEILECNMPRLDKKLKTIENKCNAYGCKFRYNVVGSVYREVYNYIGKPQICKFIVVEVEGQAIVNNWEFVAEIEKTVQGNILRGVSNIEIPKDFYYCEPCCEHCGSKRKRKYTYLVRNKETNKFMQLGKSCLRDYTHGLSAELVAQYIAAFEELIKGEEPYAGCNVEEYLDLEKFLIYAYESVRVSGYIKTQEGGTSTAVKSHMYYAAEQSPWLLPEPTLRECRKEMCNLGINFENKNAKMFVKKALQWLRTLPETSTYIHNMRVLCNENYITQRNIGFAASLIPMYSREVRALETENRKNEDMQRQAKVSEYVGNIGDRVEIMVASIKCVAKWNTDYCVMSRYKIEDKKGNIYVWKTSKFIDCETEIPEKIRGTVKEHNEYKGIKQTELTRCKLL